MKKIIPFIVAIVVAVVAFFGLQHFAPAEVKEEISHPNLTIETTSAQEVVSEPEVTPTPAPTVTPAPTEDPQLMYVMKDPVTGKIFYQFEGSEELLLQRIHENISAEEAVDAVECVNYGAMMVVAHDDERIIDDITAYDLISDEDALKVTFNRNGNKLYVCEEKSFQPSDKSDKTFKGLSDKKAYSAWICSEHTAFKASALLYEGYPESDGYRGPFAVSDGFSAKVLKSVRLIHTEGNRYDWVLVSCECKDVVATKKPSGGNGGGSKPTKQPTQAPTQEPTQEPENNSRPSANPTAKPTQAPENNSRPSAKPTAKPTQAPTQAPVTEPESNSRPNTGSGTPSTESTGGSTAGESSGRPNTGSGSSEGSGRPTVGGNTGSGSVSSDADPFA